MIRQWRRRLRALVRGRALDRELDDEMRLHLDLETEALVQSGACTRDEAQRRALIAFGGVERYKEAHRDARGVRWVDELRHDVLYAVRGLCRSPAFSLSAVLVLALGIGAGTTVVGAVHAVLLSHLPYPRDEQLMEIGLQDAPTVRWHLTTVDFRALEAQQRSFSSVGAQEPREVTMQVPGAEPTREQLTFTTSGVFRALEVRPVRGRVIGPDDEAVGAPPVAMVSTRFAIRTFGGPARAVGRTIMIDGTAHAVVGVLPVGQTTLARWRGDVWPVLQLQPPTRRGPFNLTGVGRLRDGVTLEAARRDLAAISERIFPEWASSFQDRTARLSPIPLRQAILGDASGTLGRLAAAVALVLLVAVANVASLMLVRATGRWREIGVRTMLGGTRARLARMLITESVILASVGSLAGFAVATLGLKVLVAVGPHVPRLDDARPDGVMAAFAASIALLVGTIVGASSVVLLLRRDGAATSAHGERLIGGGRLGHMVHGAFIVAQFALTLPLLLGAGLMLNSLVRLLHVTPGFDARRVLVVHVGLPSAQYANDTAIASYWARALPRIRELPGVVQVGLNDVVPPREPDLDFNNFDLVDRPSPPGGAQPVEPWMTSTSEYFTTLGVPLLEGRLFTPADSASAPPVVVVSHAWAMRYYPDGGVVGRRFIEGGCVTCPPTTVVGVVGDVKVQGLNEGATAMYAPVSQGWPRSLNVFVRTAGPPAEMTRRVQAALRSVDASVPLDDAAPMEDHVSASVIQPRHWTALLGGFAVAALALSAVGIFGMLSLSVNARRREIGVRMALGARPQGVIGMVVLGGMGYAVAGATVGLAVALAGTRWLAAALFQVRPTDPPTLAVVTLVLLTTALGACWLPARRAAGIDPATALRLE